MLYQARTEIAGEGRARALSEALDQLDPAPVSTAIDDHDDGSGLWDVSAHFGARPDHAGLALITHLHGARDFGFSRVEDQDWVAQVRAELTPVEAGRFVVFGSHDRARIGAHRIGLEIEAAEAFGTGHHATTQGCLLALDGLVRRGWVPGRVADIGGGTGVLAMAAVSAWPARAIAGDIDAVATRTARANVAANRLSGRVRAVTAAGFRHPAFREAAPFGLVFANILAAPLKRLAPDMAAHQTGGGVAVLSGLLTRQAPGVAAVYAGFGYRVANRVVRNGWTTLVLRRG